MPPPLPQTEPPPLLDFDVEENETPAPASPPGEPPNPLLVPVAMERLLGSSGFNSPGGPGNGADPSLPMSPNSVLESVAAAALPVALERSIRIKKGSDPLGVNVEVVDGGCSGVLITSVTKGGAVHRDGRLRPGDYLVSVNNETMRYATNAQARAILRRTQLVSTDVR